MTATLATGAGMRRTGPAGGLPVVCVNGGTARVVPGDWSASLEWLVGALSPAFPAIAFWEVRYRVKSWTRLDECMADARAALDAVHDAPRSTLVIGFSMGGAVAIGCADHPSVRTVVGLAPWIPDRLDVSAMEGKRLAVIHGSLDRSLPGIPGVPASSSRAGAARVAAAGGRTSYSLIRGALHPVAVRAPGGRPLPLPRARTWTRLVAAEIERFQTEEDA